MIIVNYNYCSQYSGTSHPQDCSTEPLSFAEHTLGIAGIDD
jgi:hypothetical protein